MIRRIRLISGSILFAYVLVHFLNHSLGIVSLQAMVAMLEGVYHTVSYRPVLSILYGSLIVHVALALYALWERRSLKLQACEAFQYVLGFSIPILAAEHVTMTRIDADLWGGNFGHYEKLLAFFWYGEPAKGALQIALLLAVWVHSCIGLRFWLRWRSWFPAAQPYLLAVALIVPTLAIVGDIVGGREIAVTEAREPGHIARLLAEQPPPANRPKIEEVTLQIQFVLLGALALVLGARLLRHQWQKRRGVALIVYPDGRSIEVVQGFTVLEASRLLGVPHASVCGGKGRCSTCRIRVRVAQEPLPEPSWNELNVLRRIGNPPNVRLACQLRPRGAVEVTPLFLDVAHARDPESIDHPEYVHGGEHRVVVLFADLRGFTGMSQNKLPYDTLFVLNRFFKAMGEGIEAAGGHLDKFMGDGLMALFGLETDPRTACRQALAAARLMSEHLAHLNEAMADDLDKPLRMAVGLHFGPAIVGDMGYGKVRSLTAVGETVTLASNLHGACKRRECELIVSETVVKMAEIDPVASEREDMEIRSQALPFPVYAFKNARDLPGRLSH
jgi:adenylate cyclase